VDAYRPGDHRRAGLVSKRGDHGVREQIPVKIDSNASANITTEAATIQRKVEESTLPPAGPGLADGRSPLGTANGSNWGC
jgi:hypothetical protein